MGPQAQMLFKARTHGIDRDDVSDPPALCHDEQTGIRGGIRRFDRVGQHELLFVRQIHQLPAGGGGERERRFADHVSAGLERSFDVLVMLLRMSRDIDGVDLVERVPVLFVRDAVDELHLPDELPAQAALAERADHELSLLRSEHRAGNALGARQIDHLAVFVEIVELADPVRAHREDIHVVAPDIVDLLAFVFLHDDLVRQARGLDGGDALDKRLLVVDLPSGFVIVVARDADDQIIAERLRPLQKPDMAVVQQVVGAVCDDLDHKLSLRSV